MPADRLKILIADDHPLFRESLARIVLELPMVEKSITASNGIEVLSYLKKENFDLIFLDLNMPGMSGIETLKELERLKYDIPVVVISMHTDPSLLLQANIFGIKGYILKNTDVEELIKVIHSVIRGDEYFSPAISKMMQEQQLHTGINSRTKNNVFEPITIKEKEVLELLCQQMSALEIADKLMVSEKTIKRHKQNLLEKTGARNQIGLVIYAVKHGIIPL